MDIMNLSHYCCTEPSVPCLEYNNKSVNVIMYTPREASIFQPAQFG